MLRHLTALFCASLALACVAAPPPPISSFIAEPVFRNPKLSPTGESIALILRHEFADTLVILDTGTMQPRQGPTISNLRILDYWWKGDENLILLLQGADHVDFFRAFNLQTRKTAELRLLNKRGSSIVNPLVLDPDRVLVISTTQTGTDLRRYDYVHDKMEVLEKNPGWVTRWLTNRNGQAIAGFGGIDGQWFMVVREKPGTPWHRIDLGHRSRPDFSPIAVAPDQHRLMGFDNVTTNTARAIYRDPLTGAEEEIFHSEEVDPSAFLQWGDDATRMRAIAYETDSIHFHYLEPADAKLAAEIDQALPNTRNYIVSTSADETRLLIRATSDVVPEIFYLLDRKAKRLQVLGGARDGINPALMSHSRFITFAARDGQKLSARLILPSRERGKPALLVSAGTYLTQRSSASYQPNLQLLASRGYACLEVDHRGVEGLGQAFAKAGEMQVATTMSDDIADAVQYVISQGWVDAKQVAIIGQGEAGVLALHALVRHQALFAAWINWGTSMDLDAVDTDSLTVGTHETNSWGLKAEEFFKLERYQRDLNPSLLLHSVKVPSFHYYSHALHERTGYKVDKELTKAHVPFTLVVRPQLTKNDPSVSDIDRYYYEATLRAFTQLLEFLQQRFPTGQAGS